VEAGMPRTVRAPVVSGIRKRVYRKNTQEVWPWNSAKIVQFSGEENYQARSGSTSTPTSSGRAERGASATASSPGTEAPSLVALTRMSREEWDRWTRGTAIRRAGYTGFKRNVAVAMGNWLAAMDDPPAEAVDVLREALEDQEPLVREHAEWALGQNVGR
jgi:hypothetical protein